ncbi:MAG: alpha/beta hydrolase [Nanoarchaeota archaeon]|nr:alpha/beta hydrolase [Nanoarchaeota archaeon]
MVHRVFLVHRWDGSPDADWYPAVKEELKARGFSVTVIPMPDAAHPTIDMWVNAVKAAVGVVDDATFFIGHSIGCQTILRFLASLSGDEHVGGAIFVGGWLTLTPESTADPASAAVALPWLSTPFDWKAVKKRVGKVTCFFSSNDPYVPLADAAVFAKELQAEIVIEEKMGHYTGDDEVTDLPQVVDELETML